LFAHRSTKKAVVHWLGEENYHGWYRLFYNAQALVSTVALFWFIMRQPDRELWRARGATKWLCRALQVAAVIYGAWAAREVGVARFAGCTNAGAWIQQRRSAETETSIPVLEAQGPYVDESGQLQTGGPFRFSRHPLNLVPLLVFWLMPRLTRNGLIFNLLMTLYLVAGSWHEDQRLRETYGEAYEQYVRSGVPFYIPGCGGSASQRPDDADAMP
jgi:hypothetical protein